jgi:hypothetical protein
LRPNTGNFEAPADGERCDDKPPSLDVISGFPRDSARPERAAQMTVPWRSFALKRDRMEIADTVIAVFPEHRAAESAGEEVLG